MTCSIGLGRVHKTTCDWVLGARTTGCRELHTIVTEAFCTWRIETCGLVAGQGTAGLVGGVTRGKRGSAPEDGWTRVASQQRWVGGYVRVQLCSRAHVCYIGSAAKQCM
jgi:hypothetical protein